MGKMAKVGCAKHGDGTVQGIHRSRGNSHVFTESHFTFRLKLNVEFCVFVLTDGEDEQLESGEYASQA